MAFTGKTVLYLLDCGDFVKIGITRAAKNRFSTLNGILGEKINLDKTVMWSMRHGDSEFLESAIKRKYINKRVENELSTTEVFSYDTKKSIIEDIGTVANALNFEYRIYKASDIFERREGTIGVHYSKEVAERIAARTIWPTSYSEMHIEEIEMYSGNSRNTF